MKIGVVSDTHKAISNIDKATPYLKQCDLILHAGDNIDDSYYLEAVTDVKVIAVKGNCDSFQEIGKDEDIITVDNRKILLCHGHHYGIEYGIYKLLDTALKSDIDIVVFGHTHRAYYKKEMGVTLINPGSLSYPRDNFGKGFGIINIKDEKITYDRISI